MTESDYLEFIGYLFAAYASGFGSGYLILSFKKLSDLI